MEPEIVRPMSQAEHSAVNAATDEARFLALLEAHRTIVLHVANAYTRSVADREDLAAEIVAGAWRSFARYDPARTFSTWLYRVALNIAISWTRRTSRHTQRRSTDETALAGIAVHDPDALAIDDDVGDLRAAVAALDDLPRALVILHLEGNPYATIAEILGITETNVATKLSRIKAHLRSAILRAREARSTTNGNG
jgi:RNA polymerase sigma-70 factor (ECF subfamily)